MKNNTKQTLKIYWSHILKYKLSGLIILFSIVAGSSINVILPLYYKKFFDVLGAEQAKEVLVNKLVDVLIVILIINFIGWIAWRIATFALTHIFAQLVADIQNTCFRYLHKHSFSYFNNNFVGALVKRVGYFTNSFRDILDRVLWDFIPLIVKMLIIITVLFWSHFILGLIVVIWLVIFVIVNWLMARYKMKFDVKRAEAQTQATGFLSDTITNNSNLKLFCGYKKETKNFFNLNEKVRRLAEFSFNLDNVFEAIQSLLMIVLEVGIFYVGIKLWEKNMFTIGDFVLLQSYVLIIFMHIWSFGKMIRRTYQNLADAEEMTMIFNTPHEIQNVRNANTLEIKRGKIELQNVDFYYHKTRKVFDKFNLTIKSCQRVALIGPSGAGKTTVIKLLLRNFDVFGGKILIDSQDISKVTQESLWKNISLVPQDPILFHRSLMENIRYGKFDATDEEVIKASKLAHCHEFISDLPEKYDTFVGERGVKLSGGERQRVAIARAILRNAPILILDEATSSLDSHSESLIQDALDKLMEKKTVIVIAHRLSTIVKMDRIVFIDEGKIIEDGTHQELIEKENGHYRKLWELQAGGFIAD
ncbi:MAG: ABC transporter ATP-binding protein [Candidatus Pacebacteria bacterium]|nr:ABC transporter ATP-binding protein [Candidatus Paceibacterota bacterium]